MNFPDVNKLSVDEMNTEIRQRISPRMPYFDTLNALRILRALRMDNIGDDKISKPVNTAWDRWRDWYKEKPYGLCEIELMYSDGKDRDDYTVAMWKPGMRWPVHHTSQCLEFTRWRYITPPPGWTPWKEGDPMPPDDIYWVRCITGWIGIAHLRQQIWNVPNVAAYCPVQEPPVYVPVDAVEEIEELEQKKAENEPSDCDKHEEKTQ